MEALHSRSALSMAFEDAKSSSIVRGHGESNGAIGLPGDLILEPQQLGQLGASLPTFGGTRRSHLFQELRLPYEDNLDLLMQRPFPTVDSVDPWNPVSAASDLARGLSPTASRFAPSSLDAQQTHDERDDNAPTQSLSNIHYYDLEHEVSSPTWLEPLDRYLVGTDIPAYAGDAQSFAMSRTHSQALSEYDDSQLGNANDTGSLNEDYAAGIPLRLEGIDRMEGLESDRDTSPNVYMRQAQDDDVVYDSNTFGLVQSAPDHFGAMFYNDTSQNEVVFGRHPLHPMRIPLERSRSTHEPHVSKRSVEAGEAVMSASFPAIDATTSVSRNSGVDAVTRTPPRAIMTAKRMRGRAASNSLLDLDKSSPSRGLTRTRRNTLHGGKLDPSRLTAILERGESGSPNGLSSSMGSLRQSSLSSSKPRAKRQGALPDMKREKVAERRRMRSTCVACKAKKTECDGEPPCTSCHKSRGGRVCLPSEWVARIEQLKCEDTAHSREGSTQQTRLTTDFAPASLLRFIYKYQASHALSITHASGAQYLVNLSTCSDLLPNTSHRFHLVDFFDPKVLNASPETWLTALTFVDDRKTEMEMLCLCSLAPTRATFKLRGLDVNASNLDVVHEEDLLAAAALFHLMLRANELVLHRAVQKVCFKLMPVSLKPNEHDGLVELVQDLGRLACAMRVRYAFLLVSQRQLDLDHRLHQQTQSSLEDVLTVAKTIYFWYYYALEKRNKYVRRDFQDSTNLLVVNGVEVRDPFPDAPNNEAFNAWLANGEHILQHTGLCPKSLQHSQSHYLHHSLRMQTETPLPFRDHFPQEDYSWLQQYFPTNVPQSFTAI